MFSSSSNKSLAQNASDGGQLAQNSIAPLTIYEGSAGGPMGINATTLALIALGMVAALAGIWLLLRK